MVYAIEPRPLLVVRLDDVPGGFRNVRAREGLLLRLRVGFPADPRLQIHWRELPLLQGIVNPHEEPELLLLVGYREPIFDQPDARADEHALELRDIVK